MRKQMFTVRLTPLQKAGLHTIAKARGESMETVLRTLLVKELVAQGLYPVRAKKVLEAQEDLV